MKVKLVSLLALVMLTSACSSLKFWEDESLSEEEIAELGAEVDENTSEPRPLKDYNESVDIRKLWRSSATVSSAAQVRSSQLAIRSRPGALDGSVLAAARTQSRSAPSSADAGPSRRVTRSGKPRDQSGTRAASGRPT